MGLGSVWLAAHLPLHVGKIKELDERRRHEQRSPRIDKIQEKIPSLDQSNIIWKRLLKLRQVPHRAPRGIMQCRSIRCRTPPHLAPAQPEYATAALAAALLEPST